MPPETLIPAVLSYLRNQNGFATKTKLLKILYLLDLLHYRTHGLSLSGFSWVFHKYGPWSPEYDVTLEELSHKGLIFINAGNRPDLDTQFVNAGAVLPLSEAFPTILEELEARRIIEAWADRPTAEILDYVYFHTAPMRDAVRGEELDLSKVLQEDPAPAYRRAHSSTDKASLKKARQALKSAFSAAKSPPHFVQPRYDEEFWKAVETLEKDPD